MPQTTREFIEIEEIKDGVIVTHAKNLRAILMVSSLNFELKSEDERIAIVGSFQRFLNFMEDYPVQILVHSRPLDLSDYYVFLRETQEKQENELLAIQISEYISFIEELVKLENIMSKLFYVVVPWNTSVAQRTDLFGKIFSRPKKEEQENRQNVQFAEAREGLMLRVQEITNLLSAMGLRAVPLGTQEILELFYGLYNPGAAIKQKNLEMLLATGDAAKQSE